MPPDSPTLRRQAGRAFALLRAAARPDARAVGLAFVLLLAAAALDVLGPLLGKALIDRYLVPRAPEAWLMAALIGGALVSGWAASLLRYFQLVRLAGAAMRSVQRLRERVFDHVLRLPMAFFDRAITGQLISRVTNDTEAVKGLYIQALFVILNSGIMLLGTTIAMAWLDVRLMLVMLTLVPAVLGIVWLYQKLSAPAVARSRQLRSEINGQMAESISGMQVLQAANAAGRFGQRFADTSWAHYQSRRKELAANAWLLRPALDLLNMAMLVVVIYSFGQRPLDAIEVGVLYAFLNYIARVIEPLTEITLQFSSLQQAVVSAARVADLLDEPGAPEHAAGRAGQRLLPLPGAPAIAMQGVRFGYVDGQPVLHGLDLRIAHGSFVGIVGHTGSGKSTLLSLLLRYYQPWEGRIEIGGHALAGLANEDFRAHVGLVPQDPFLLAASVRENIDMGRGLSQAAIEAAARAAHAHDFIGALEQGYDTDLGENGARLSTGQKQLIAIARALAGQPAILLLDEATAHIDSATEQVVQAALHALRGQVTVVAIAHRLSTIREADHIVVLNHGRLAEAGEHAALMAIEGGIYQRLYQLQQIAA
ncbi:ABC transporter ATP-binding protein [Massilia sp. TS11]|uniref:ABC transporter ATP-binding protein n=1 Tax=Massilia sp. TS11 TaxID=2908003 RepID=UPI001EDB8E4D|nr:ABC transporter transmembrane domain-containing protein [Massilia sp. TS11]MCG2583708.1 ATP-binding cassette domain-containing protein [Massilia sp. TS11]